jgi:hypothetical protein
MNDQCTIPPEEAIYSVSKCSFSQMLKNRQHGLSLPVSEYIDRLRKYFRCPVVVFMYALVYIDKYLLADQLDINQLCIHRLLLVFLVIAVKYLQDEHFKNSYYARVGGISTHDLNTLEKHVLSSLSFNLHVKPELLLRYSSQINTHLTECNFCNGQERL